MKRPTAFLFAAILVAAPAVFAADDDALSEDSDTSRVVRQDSLELPGLTACHQCEWRPKPNFKAAGEQCGFAPDGKAHVAEFECGFSEDCERVCNFVRCADQ